MGNYYGNIRGDILKKVNTKVGNKGTLYTLISGVSFGTYPILAKLAYGTGLNEISLIFFRCSGTALLLFIVIKLREKRGEHIKITVNHKKS